MRKATLILIGILLISLPAYAAFSDIPEKHWAKPAIYKLLKLGAIQGYPDGTFKGGKNVTRYETASLLNNLVTSAHQNPKLTKLIAEFENEINIEKYRAAYPGNPTLTGSLLGSFYLSKKDFSEDFLSEYRVKLKLKRKFDKTRNIAIDFDSLDAGFNSGTERSFPEELIDFQGNFKFSGWDFGLSFGAGDLLHSDTYNPSNNGIVFQRKKPKITAKLKNPAIDLFWGYTVLKSSPANVINCDDFFIGSTIKLKRLPLFGPTKIAELVRHAKKGDQRDIRAELRLVSRPIDIYFGAGGSGLSALYIGGKIKFYNLMIQIHKAESKYRTPQMNKYEYLPLNLFNRYILDGTTDIGAVFTHSFSKVVGIKLMSDIVLDKDYKYGKDYPGTTHTSQANLIFNFGEKARLNLFYRLYEAPSGLNYPDPEISSVVPAKSDMLGLSFEADL